MEKTIAGKTITVNEEGYLTNFNQWDEKVGEALAEESHINLSPKHWQVLKYLMIRKLQSPDEEIITFLNSF